MVYESKFKISLLALILLLCISPYFFHSEYYFTLGITVCTFAVLSAGLNLLYGYIGLLSFAQVAFFGIGAYTSAILVTQNSWTIWTALPIAGIFTGIVGAFVGYTSLKLSRHAFAIVTLSFSLLCTIIAREWISLTRGSMGIPGLPAPTINIPSLETIVLDRPNYLYPVFLIYTVLALFLFYRLGVSRIGRALKAIKLDEPLASSQGINVLSHKILAIVVSAVLSGMVGGLFVFHLTIVDPSIFDFYYTESMLIMVIIGGPGSYWGVLCASILFSVIPDLLRFSSDLRMVAYGVLLIISVLILPNGVAGFLRNRNNKRWKIH